MKTQVRDSPMPDVEVVRQALVRSRLPATEKEVQGLAETYRALRAAIDSLYTRPRNSQDEPIIAELSPVPEEWGG
jgi:hypothetical protein